MRSREYPLLQFLTPSVIIILLVFIVPIIYLWQVSFLNWNPLRGWYPQGFAGLNNYVRIIKDPVFFYSVFITVGFASCSVALEFAVGLGLALFLSHNVYGRRIFRGLILIPMMLTPVVVGLIWKFMLNETFGVLNIILRNYFGVTGLKWHGSVRTALPTVIMIDVWEWTPFMFAIFLAGISAIPPSLYEQAMIDGASGWKRFINITLPLLKPIIVIAVLLRFFEAMKCFDTIWILTQGGPVRATSTLSILIFRQAFKFFNLGYASALSVLFLMMVVAYTLVLMRSVRFKV